MAVELVQAWRAIRRDGLASIGGKAARYVHGRRDARSALRAWRLASEPVASVGDAVEVVYAFRAGPISLAPFQIRYEITSLVERVREAAPRTVLQIGTCTGGTLYLLTRFSAPDAVVVSVDLPHGPFGGGYPPWMEPIFKSFASAGQRIRLVLGDSHESSTLERVRTALGQRPVDFLFIDGDHSYDGVRRDFELYGPLVRPGGLVAFHDIVPGPVENVGGVPRFWSELKRGNDAHTEIVESWDQGSAGIGIIEVRARNGSDGHAGTASTASDRPCP